MRHPVRFPTRHPARRARATLATLLAVTFALAATFACGSEEPKAASGTATAAEATPPPQPAPAATRDDPSPAAEPAAAAAGNPYACIPGDASRGATKYALLCASCHGPEGKGDGPAAAGLDPAPASHADGAVMNGLTNEYLHEVIAKGGAAVGKSPLMAPWGGAMSKQELWDAVAFVRTLAKPAYACP